MSEYQISCKIIDYDRYLERVPADETPMDPDEWAITSARLSQFWSAMFGYEHNDPDDERFIRLQYKALLRRLHL